MSDTKARRWFAPQNRGEQLLINVEWWSEETNGVSREQQAAQLWERWIKS